jgi:hypothetical protein
MANIEERGNPNPHHDAEGKFSTQRRAKTVSFNFSSPKDVVVGKGKNGKPLFRKIEKPAPVRYRPERGTLSIQKGVPVCGRLARMKGDNVRCYDGEVLSRSGGGVSSAEARGNKFAPVAGAAKAGAMDWAGKQASNQNESLQVFENMYYRPMLEQSAVDALAWIEGDEGEWMAETEDGLVTLLAVDDEGGAYWAIYTDEGDDPSAEGEADTLAAAKELAGKAALAALASHGFVADPEVMEEIQNGVSLTSHLERILSVG